MRSVVLCFWAGLLVGSTALRIDSSSPKLEAYNFDADRDDVPDLEVYPFETLNSKKIRTLNQIVESDVSPRGGRSKKKKPTQQDSLALSDSAKESAEAEETAETAESANSMETTNDTATDLEEAMSPLQQLAQAKRKELQEQVQQDQINEFRPRFARVPTRKGIDKARTNPHNAGKKGIEVFWQRPKGEIKGVFFGATGCFHQGGDFFSKLGSDGWVFEDCKHTNIKTCQGLPESVYVNKYARARGYLFMTATPDGKNSCWEHKNDASRVRDALDFVIKVENLPEDIPMFATGASQGGYLMWDLQAQMGGNNLKCIAPQCAEIKDTVRHGGEHLPTMFIYMKLQTHTGAQENIVPMIQGDMARLQRKGVRVSHRVPSKWPIAKLMEARGYDNATVACVSKSLGSATYLGHKSLSKDGIIIDHPGTESWWLGRVRHCLKGDRLQKDHSKFHQLMQVAYAEHEITAEYVDHIIDFCEDNEDHHAPLRFGRKPNFA